MIPLFMVDNFFFLAECLIEEGVSPTALWRGFIITTTRRQVVKTTTTTLGPSNRSDCLMRSQTRATGVAKIRVPCMGMLTVLYNLCKLKVKKLCAVLCNLNQSFRFHYRMNLISEFIFYNSIFCQVKRLRQIVHLDNKRLLHSPFISFIQTQVIVVKWQKWCTHIYKIFLPAS